jgi:hypothetical protein
LPQTKRSLCLSSIGGALIKEPSGYDISPLHQLVTKELAKTAADVIRQIEERNADAQTSPTQSREAASEPLLDGVGAE